MFATCICKEPLNYHAIMNELISLNVLHFSTNLKFIRTTAEIKIHDVWCYITNAKL